MELYPGLHRIATTFPPNNLWLYLLRGKDAAILIDSGCNTTPDAVIYPYLAELGMAPQELTHLVVTHAHADHFGGNAAVKARSPNVKLVAHVLEQPFIESTEHLLGEWYQGQFVRLHGFGFSDEICEWMRGFIGPNVGVNMPLTGGEHIALDDEWEVEIVHAPGHMPGHIIVWDAAHGCAIIGDALLGRGVAGMNGIIHSPPPYFEVESYLNTIAVIEALQPELIVSAHYPDKRGDQVPAFIRDSRAFVEDCNAAVPDVFAGARQPMSLKEIISGVDARLGPFDTPDAAWLAPVNAHLLDLETRGAVRVAEPGPPRRWVKV